MNEVIVRDFSTIPVFSSVTVISESDVNAETVDLDVNANGIGAIAYQREGSANQIVARYTKDGGTTWGPYAFLSSPELIAQYPNVSASLRGDVGFSWAGNNLPFAAYTTNGNTYKISPPLSSNDAFLPTESRTPIATALDAFGNQMVLWTDGPSTNLFYSFRVRGGEYSRPFVLNNGIGPQVAATYDGLFVDLSLSGLNLVSSWTVLLPPTDLRIASQTSNRFPTLSNLETVLRWTGGRALTAPLTPGNTITSYFIFRNGRLIGEVPASANPAFLYTFVDCSTPNRAVYSVASDGPYGMSAPFGLGGPI